MKQCANYYIFGADYSTPAAYTGKLYTPEIITQHVGFNQYDISFDCYKTNENIIVTYTTIAKITIQKAKIPASFTDQPVTITQDNGLTALTTWWAVLDQANNGTDVRAYSDAACTTELKRYAVYVDVANKLIELGVKIPAMSNAADYVFYLKAGDTPKANDTDVFPTTDQYYPLQTTTPTDYGPNAVTGTGTDISASAGKVGNGSNVNNTNSVISGLERALETTWSLGFWIQHAQHRESNREIFVKGYYIAEGNYKVWQLYFNTSGKLAVWIGRNGADITATSTAVYDDNVLRHIAIVSDSGYIDLYVNSVFVEHLYFGSGFEQDGYATILGNWLSNGYPVIALIDSLRIVKRNFSSELPLIYNMESDPTTFATAELA